MPDHPSAAGGRGAVAVVGLHGGVPYGSAAADALAAADVVFGSARQLADLPAGLRAEPVTAGPLGAVLAAAAARRDDGRRVVLLASGDPGFFGLARLAVARLGPVAIHPAPSSAALAFARVGTNWDDAAVVSAHGRPLAPAVDAVRTRPKVAVLVSPDQPPEALGRALLAEGCGPRTVTVCSRLGEPDETVTTTDLAGLAAGTWDPRSVVVAVAPSAGTRSAGTATAGTATAGTATAGGAATGAGAADGPGVAWGGDNDAFAHRDGMITKAEVRAVALGKLSLPAVGVLWDVGAGSASVAVEASRLAPGLEVYAVERRADDAARARANAAGTAVVVVEGESPGALEGLPDPDRVFVGGGGLPALDAALARLRPGGVVVATWAAVERAVAAADRLGHLVQVGVSRGTRIGPDRSWRLAAENPVFVTWGPTPDDRR